MTLTTLTTLRPVAPAPSSYAVPSPSTRHHDDDTRGLQLPAASSAAVVARAVAERRHLWAPHARFDPARPVNTVVWHDDRWEVSLEAWLPGQASAVVEQLDRPGALLVLQGELAEGTWVTATDGPEPGRRHAVVRRYAAGAIRSHGAVHVHDVRNPGPYPALALHVRTRTRP